MKPHVDASTETVLASINTPAMNVTIATLRTRAMGSLSVRMTTANTDATDAARAISE